MKNFSFFVSILSFSLLTIANPYFDQTKVPLDSSYHHFSAWEGSQRNKPERTSGSKMSREQMKFRETLRVLIDWNENDESFKLTDSVLERSGTDSLYKRAHIRPQWGSYVGILKSKKTGAHLAYDSIGTGREFRKLVRALTFRFPVFSEPVTLEVIAENPTSGKMESVLNVDIESPRRQNEIKIEGIETRLISKAIATPSIQIVIYAEGYSAQKIEKFFKDAEKTSRALKSDGFPQADRFEILATFAPSNLTLGPARNLGLPVPVRDSFLGLYFPYWQGLDRWYNIVYPTQEKKFREALATTPYDYPIAIINDSQYWGVGNYNAFTAVPSDSSSFVYLLWHEFGHFFGLNEEYEGGGPTELEFAFDIESPFSQNMIFRNEANQQDIKWKSFVNPSTSLPTPDWAWKNNPPVYGAYSGGYADSKSKWGSGLKPGLRCVMESAPTFCDICKAGIKAVTDYTLGVR